MNTGIRVKLAGFVRNGDNMWGIIFAAFVILAVFGILYIVLGFRRFGFIKYLKTKHKLWGLLCIVLPAIIIGLLIMWNLVNAAIIVIYWLIFWLFCDLTAFIIRKLKKIRKNKDSMNFKPYIAGVTALILTFAYFTYGWFAAHTVVETNYTVETDKLAAGESFRIIQISDSHTGAIFDGNRFMEYADEMSRLDADVVLVTGDLVDDGTSYEDMVLSCKAIASINSTYGTYYVYGNHDKRYFGNGSYTAEQLKECLKENGIKILEDNYELIADDRMAVIGRRDASVKDRKDAELLKSNIPDDIYSIVLDHQPTDYNREQAMRFDLVLSGHTHGGQLFPMGQISSLFGINDMVYGIEQRDATTFIVNSGIADWEIQFKTGCISEYVVVDIIGTK